MWLLRQKYAIGAAAGDGRKQGANLPLLWDFVPRVEAVPRCTCIEFRNEQFQLCKRTLYTIPYRR